MGNMRGYVLPRAPYLVDTPAESRIEKYIGWLGLGSGKEKRKGLGEKFDIRKTIIV